MDATKLAGALKWKWPNSSCDYYFDVSGNLNVYNWTGGAQPSNSEIEQAVLDYVTSPEYLIEKFDFKRLWGTIWAQAITPTGLVELPPYAKTIEDIWNYPNRGGVYPYMQMLVAAGKGTTDDLAIIVAAFAQQGIDIQNIQ